MSSIVLLNGDCHDVMRQFHDGHFGAIITEPPVGYLNNAHKVTCWLEASDLWRMVAPWGSIILMTNPEPGYVLIRKSDRIAVHKADSALTTYPDRGCPFARPVAAVIELVKQTEGLILDPYAGSCSTLLAARECDRDAVGIEYSRSQCIAAAPFLK